MRLRPVSPYPRVILTCSSCGTPINTPDRIALSDLDGTAFRAYYCEACADKMKANENMCIKESLWERSR